jgi:hypothetical protein
MGGSIKIDNDNTYIYVCNSYPTEANQKSGSPELLLSKHKVGRERKRTQVFEANKKKKKGYQKCVPAHPSGTHTSHIQHRTSYISQIHHTLLLPTIIISRIPPTPPVRQETQPLLKRAVAIAITMAIAISARTTRPAIHTRPPVKETQPPTTGAPITALLSRMATTAFVAETAAAVRLLLLALLVQTAAQRADRAALQKRQRAPTAASESRLRRVRAFFGSDGGFVRDGALAGLPSVWAQLF